ncbi:MAG TPA: sigma-70 family RNA polymerase sigma factor [Gaiellaceae bacterium]|jgi:RNA polymerase sigma-70 factor (ECF subfamily)
MRDPLANPQPLIRQLYAYVAYVLGDGPDAEDVTSEAFERALRYRSSYDPGKGAPIAWLIGIARRCIAPHLAARRELSTPAAIDEAAAPGAEFADRTVTEVAVRQAVQALGERDQELVALRFGSDLTCRQIGELLGLRTNAVEVALHRALARLERILADDENAVRDRAQGRYSRLTTDSD